MTPPRYQYSDARQGLHGDMTFVQIKVTVTGERTAVENMEEAVDSALEDMLRVSDREYMKTAPQLTFATIKDVPKKTRKTKKDGTEPLDETDFTGTPSAGELADAGVGVTGDLDKPIVVPKTSAAAKKPVTKPAATKKPVAKTAAQKKPATKTPAKK